MKIGPFVELIFISRGYLRLIIAVVAAVISCVGSCIALIAENCNWKVNREPDGGMLENYYYYYFRAE